MQWLCQMRMKFISGALHGLLIPDAVATDFASMAELFGSLDTPMMLEPMEFDRNESRLEKLRQNFDVQVAQSHQVKTFSFIHFKPV